MKHEKVMPRFRSTTKDTLSPKTMGLPHQESKFEFPSSNVSERLDMQLGFGKKPIVVMTEELEK